MTQVVSVILAAGKGTRMKSKMPKVLHKVCGKPMLSHVIRSAKEAGAERIIAIIGHEAEQVKNEIGEGPEWANQIEQLGTGHAVMQVESMLQGFAGTILILCGDTPLITAESLKSLLEKHVESGNSATVLTARLENPSGYGRIIRSNDGQVEAIIEHKDASPDQLQINEINTGIYCFNGKELFAALKKIKPVNAQGEYYLTDVLSVLKEEGKNIGAVMVKNNSEVMGINNRVQLAEAEKVMRRSTLERLMMSGVTIIDPDSTYIDRNVVIEQDSVVYPGTIIEGNCRIGKNCIIGPYTRLKDVVFGRRITVQNSIVLESVVGDGAVIGPFAYIRPDSVLHDSVKVGDFVEIKKSIIGTGSKIPHLSYIGDAEIGEKVNVGAGTITCNYDGYKKYKTVIGNEAFIGSNANLVAPVVIGDQVVIGAGSTVTKDVPNGSLCVERSKQEIYPDYIARKNKKK